MKFANMWLLMLLTSWMTFFNPLISESVSFRTSLASSYSVTNARASVAQLTFFVLDISVFDCETEESIPSVTVQILVNDQVVIEEQTDENGKVNKTVTAFISTPSSDQIEVRINKEGFEFGQTLAKVTLIFLNQVTISTSACMMRTEPPVPCTETLEVGQSLQATLDGASEDDVICLASGTYAVPSSVVIHRGVSLVGLGSQPERVVLRGNGDEPVVVIETDGEVLIQNLTVREGSGALSPEQGSIYIRTSPAVRLSRILVEENIRIALYIEQSNVRIEQSRVFNNDAHGVWIRGSTVTIAQTTIQENAGSGITVLNTLVKSFGDEDLPSRVTIEDSTIEDNGFAFSEFHGIAAWNGSELVIRRSNFVFNYNNGIFAQGWGQLILEENIIEDNDARGVRVRGDVRTTLRNNDIRFNGDGVALGWGNLVGESISAEFIGNIISDNFSCGVRIDQDAPITITGSGNTLTRNDEGNLCGASNKVPSGF